MDTTQAFVSLKMCFIRGKDNFYCKWAGLSSDLTANFAWSGTFPALLNGNVAAIATFDLQMHQVMSNASAK